MSIAHGNVVRIKKIGKMPIERLISRQMRLKEECFEKPARMCQMPFRGAHIRHRLNDKILRHQRPTQQIRELPNAIEARREIIAISGNYILFGNRGRRSNRRMHCYLQALPFSDRGNGLGNGKIPLYNFFAG